jgi:CelD/BcsL family acetyltransferase involved in cellulose biosynthesis
LDFIGYDPAYAQYSPGTFLLMELFEDLVRNNVKQIDFTLGYEDYKQHFANLKWEVASVYIFGPNLKGIMLRVLRTLTGMVRWLIKESLDPARLLKIRRIWRKPGTPQPARGTKP